MHADPHALPARGNPMAAADRPQALAPIVVDLFVPCPPDRAFEYFTRDIGRWWPLGTHSLGQADTADVHFEAREGGRLIETRHDGREHTWGTVTAWQPGHRVAFSWHLDRDPATAQWVDVRFAADPAGTQVTLTHGGWERREDGATVRENYVGGWKIVFGERYGGYCNSGLAKDTGSPPARG
jgi:Activator of Hsp90 ATPase homolog 1-like protein